MLQRLVAQWLRQQAQEAILRSATDAREDSDDSAESKPSAVDVLCFFPSAEEAGGFVDRLSDLQTLKCHGFVERIGQLDETVVGVVETSLPHEQFAPVVRDVAVASPAVVGAVVRIRHRDRSGCETW